MKKLYEVVHAYYCHTYNYYSNNAPVIYNSWQEFFDEEGDSDDDMNLIFRWDWINNEELDVDDEQKNFDFQNDILHIFYMGQRKGLFRVVSINVLKSDEPVIKQFLQQKYEYMKNLWAPFCEE